MVRMAAPGPLHIECTCRESRGPCQYERPFLIHLALSFLRKREFLIKDGNAVKSRKQEGWHALRKVTVLGNRSQARTVKMAHIGAQYSGFCGDVDSSTSHIMLRPQ